MVGGGRAIYFFFRCVLCLTESCLGFIKKNWGEEEAEEEESKKWIFLYLPMFIYVVLLWLNVVVFLCFLCFWYFF